MPSRITVASAPRRHSYTRHLLHPAVPVTHVATPDRGYRAAQVMDARWVDAHADELDVFHVHFGFGDVPDDQVEAWLAALHRHGIPLVYTAHDLENPHLEDQARHRRQLDVLMARADAVVTLTGRASDRIRRRWGRDATVIPHPHVVDLRTAAAAARRPQRPAGEVVVGVHCKDNRAGMDVWPTLQAVLEVIADRADVRLRVDVRPGLAREDPDLARRVSRLAGHPRVEVRVMGYVPDGVLWRYLMAIDVAVLPYVGGTHSGWAEACVDVGTAVVVPDDLAVADQHPPPRVVGVRRRGVGPDPADLAAAIDAVRAHGRPRPPTPGQRAAQRLAIARRHHALYADLIHRAGAVAA